MINSLIVDCVVVWTATLRRPHQSVKVWNSKTLPVLLNKCGIELILGENKKTPQQSAAFTSVWKLNLALVTAVRLFSQPSAFAAAVAAFTAAEGAGAAEVGIAFLPPGVSGSS